ncbi:MAG TPA: superoxide dismutase [Candidatus Magasanikbacteria bacterium]|nr:superoxide dismutase [Candidatus Magasanikbacteria bacterium]
MKHELYQLPYDFNALEPHIDAKTMEIHYTKHHQTYLDKFLEVVKKYPELEEKSAEDILRSLQNLAVEEADRTTLRNHGGGLVNHNLYWSIMGPQKNEDTNLKKEIEAEFGSVDSFKEQFTTLGTKHFGSGWAWLVRDENGKLKTYSLPNQDSPYMQGHTPVIGLDVWEHAYYLKHQNKRPDYIKAWWEVVTLL